MNSPLLTGRTLSSISLAYWARLIAMAAARRTMGLLNGSAARFNRMQFMSGSPTKWVLSSM